MFSSSVRRLVSSPSVRQFFGNRIRASDLTIGNYCSTVKVSNMTSFHDFKAKKLDGEEVRSSGHSGTADSYVTPLSVLSASKKPVIEPSSFLSFYLIHFSFREAPPNLRASRSIEYLDYWLCLLLLLLII